MSRPSSLAFSGRAEAPPETVIYAVGDIHGRADLLQGLLEKVVEDAKLYNKGRIIFLTLGDLVDRGDYTKETLELLLNIPPEWEHVSLRGNHEEMLLNFLEAPADNFVWLLNGGLAVLQNYGLKVFRPVFNPVELRKIAQEFRQKIPARHLEYLKKQRLYYQAGNYFFAHAGARPGIPLNQQKKDDLLWIREEFLAEDYNFGPLIIHGHTVSKTPHIGKNRVGIDTGAFFSGRLTCLVLQGSQAWFI